ncbi:hypothetical protein [Aliarcobacter butzleri]|uniref:hypothetical protein n=1 Tax=Aliarcobacter butzleri TaxID=28197 RepID=UPI002B246EFF|nr:hypothetical protein [Aliarcobacter butzleri]
MAKLIDDNYRKVILNCFFEYDEVYTPAKKGDIVNVIEDNEDNLIVAIDSIGKGTLPKGENLYIDIDSENKLLPTDNLDFKLHYFRG